MTLLTVCRSVLAETGWPALSAIASNTDGTAQQIFEIANTELTNLSQGFDWPQLETEYNFNTVPTQQNYLFPADFRAVEHNSAFDKAQYYPIRGSVSIEEWNARKNGLLANVSRTAFRIIYVNGAPGFELVPTPSTVRALVVNYWSKYFAYDSNGVAIPGYAADSDVSKVPEDMVKLGVKWRFRRIKGLDFSAELSEYNAMLTTRFAKAIAQADIPVGGRTRGDWPLTNGFVRQDGFGA
jgi:hypothetical protein